MGVVRRTAAALFLAALAAGTSPVLAQAPVVLVTEQEAAEPPPGAPPSVTRGITRGPTIEDIAPRDGQDNYLVPGPFRLRIVTRNEVPVDPDAVRLFYLRERAIDITQRVRPFIAKNEINVPAVIMPRGTHVFRVEVADAMGRKSSTLITVKAAQR